MGDYGNLNRNGTAPHRELRLIHTSDVHLESDTLGVGERGERYRAGIREAFSRVITVANRERADLLLIVGDLFDHNRVNKPAIEFAMAQIGRAQMPVVMIPGNHDACEDGSIYASLGRLPTNLNLILEPQGALIDLPHLATRVWGRALVEHSPAFQPLAGLPAPEAGRWNIALAHGLYTDDPSGERSSPITPGEIASSGYDYVALGHVHVFNDCSQGMTRALYCGTPSPIQRGEAGAVVRVTCRPDAPLEVVRLPLENAV